MLVGQIRNAFKEAHLEKHRLLVHWPKKRPARADQDANQAASNKLQNNQKPSG